MYVLISGTNEVCRLDKKKILRKLFKHFRGVVVGCPLEPTLANINNVF